MKKFRFIALALILLIMIPLAASCAAKENAADRDIYYDNSISAPDYAPESAGKGEDGKFDGFTSDSSAGAIAPPSSASNPEYERKIIKTVNMTAETKEYDKAISSIADMIAANGGYIESSSTNGKSYNNYGTYRRYASYTIRIPAENLDAFLGQVGGVLNVTSNNASQNDVSGSYYDIVSRLETLNAEKTALLAMYEKAETVEYMLQIQQRLYDVIEEIEAYTTRLNYYDGQVSYSTVHLNLNEVIEYTDVADPITYGERIADAFKDSWEDFGEGCQDFSIWFVGAIPTLLVLAVIGGAIALIVISIVRKPRAKKVEKKDE